MARGGELFVVGKLLLLTLTDEDRSDVAGAVKATGQRSVCFEMI